MSARMSYPSAVFPCCNSGQSWDKELPQPTRDHRMNRLLGFLAVAIEGLELLSNTLFSKPNIMPERSCFAIANANRGDCLI
ncbi:hypothetical protein PVAP13_8NG356101 [Panicum virgatum]|uniref:Uncharacterized protein n=1 Tax=Panicum virgatum TaxID=38727 RepID=A0A8T0P5S6_PANVG|nr:hypothetical protein PVAP13_8NG356101 [Panicum virgatum]